MCVQELSINYNTEIITHNIAGYTRCNLHSGNGYGNVVSFVKNGIDFSIINYKCIKNENINNYVIKNDLSISKNRKLFVEQMQSKVYMIVLEIRSKESNYLVINYYRPPNHSIIDDFCDTLDVIINSKKFKKHKIIIYLCKATNKLETIW